MGIYRIIDKAMLGAFSVTELGYFENAEKIINLPIAIITALGTVMLPHMSYVMQNKKENVKNKIYESMKLALLLAITMSVCLMFISNEAAIIIFGEEFVKKWYNNETVSNYNCCICMGECYKNTVLNSAR